MTYAEYEQEVLSKLNNRSLEVFDDESYRILSVGYENSLEIKQVVGLLEYRTLMFFHKGGKNENTKEISIRTRV